MPPTPIVKNPKATDMFECLESHTSDQFGTYREGDTLRGSHPDVSFSAMYWVPAGLSTDEKHEARQERIYKRMLEKESKS